VCCDVTPENLLIDYVKVVDFGFDFGCFATVVTTRTCTRGTPETETETWARATGRTYSYAPTIDPTKVVEEMALALCCACLMYNCNIKYHDTTYTITINNQATCSIVLYVSGGEIVRRLRLAAARWCHEIVRRLRRQRLRRGHRGAVRHGRQMHHRAAALSAPLGAGIAVHPRRRLRPANRLRVAKPSEKHVRPSRAAAWGGQHGAWAIRDRYMARAAQTQSAELRFGRPPLKAQRHDTGAHPISVPQQARAADGERGCIDFCASV